MDHSKIYQKLDSISRESLLSIIKEILDEDDEFAKVLEKKLENSKVDKSPTLLSKKGGKKSIKLGNFDLSK